MKLPKIIAVAPNGARKTKADHPAIPLTAKELGRTAQDCLEAGASMIHLHVRDKQQKHSLSVDLYKEAINEIRKQTDDSIFIQATSESVGRYTPSEQFEMIHHLQPPAVSIGLREIRGESEAFINQHFNRMRKKQVLPQLIFYNSYDVAMYLDWLERGVLPGSAYPILLVVGKLQKEGVFESNDLKRGMIADLPFKSWMTCGFGAQEYEVAERTYQLGGHIRVGFENNERLKDESIASGNTELIEQVATMMNVNGSSPINVSKVREQMKPDW